jgi:superfamily II DNA or RNA helicase
MQVSLNNIYCQVTKFDYRGEEDILDECLTVMTPGYKFMPRYKTGQWDGTYHFYHHNSMRFPAGFLPLINTEFQTNDFPVILTDLRPDLQTPFYDYAIPKPVLKKLRDYQASEITSVLNNRLMVGGKAIPWRRGVLKHPTGSGKSITALGLIETVDQPTLYLIERKRLLHQFAGQYAEFSGKVPGQIGDGLYDLAKVTIASVASLVTRLGDPQVRKYLETVQVVIADECQHVKTGRYTKIMNACRNASVRLGMSGTPLQRGDLGDIQLIGTTGELISTLERAPLEKEGYLAPVKVKFITMDSGRKYRMSYDQAYKQLIVENGHRNTRIVKAAVAEVTKREAKVLILVRYLLHGNILQSLFEEHTSLNTVFIHGSVPSDEQREVIKSFETTGGIDVIIATAILDEGVDIPVANVLINAAGGQSEIKTVQRVGRVVRPKADDSFVRVYDFFDKDNEYLLKHSLTRLQTYKAENFGFAKSSEHG